MKKIIYLACVIMCFVVGGAGAVSQIVEVGPYDVTFDSGLDEPLEVFDSEVDVDNDSNTVTYIAALAGQESEEDIVAIFVIDYDLGSMSILQPFINGVVVSKELMNDTFGGWFNTPIQSTYLEIDGQQAVIGRGRVADNSSELYSAIWPVKNNMAFAFLISRLPWEDGTSSLVKTIHVERRDIWIN